MRKITTGIAVSALLMAGVPMAYALTLPPPPPPDTSGKAPQAPSATRTLPSVTPVPALSVPQTIRPAAPTTPVVPVRPVQPAAPVTKKPPEPEPEEASEPEPVVEDEPVEIKTQVLSAEPKEPPLKPEGALLKPEGPLLPEKVRVELSGRVLADSRVFHFLYADKQDDAGRVADFMDLRSARIEARAIKRDYYEAKVSADFGVNKIKLADAYLDWRVFDTSAIRFGQFYYPFGNETQGSRKYLMFIEKSFATEVASSGRDKGVGMLGEVFEGRVFYQMAAMQGAGDNTADTNDAIDGVGRLIARLWAGKDANGLWLGGSYANGLHRAPKHDEFSILAESRSGVAVGDKEGAAYFKMTIPQGTDYYIRKIGYEVTGVFGPLRLQAEQFSSAISIGQKAEFRGGYAAVAWAFGQVQHKFKKGAWSRPEIGSPLTLGGYGALEIAARYSWISVDDLFIQENGLYPGWKAIEMGDPNFYTDHLRSWTWGVNWYPDPFTRIMFNWVITTTGSISDGIKDHYSADESAYLLRFQVEF